MTYYDDTLEQMTILTRNFTLTLALLCSKIKIPWTAPRVKWVLKKAGFSPTLCNFQNSCSLSRVPLEVAWSRLLRDSPANWLGIARALIIGLYTLKGKEKMCCTVLKPQAPYLSKMVLIA